MIDFRYHLVSIVAVLFAIAIGIVVGSGYLAGPLRRQLVNAVESVGKDNERLLRTLGERERTLREYERFAVETKGALIRDALAGRDVVVLTVNGTDGTMLDGLRTTIADAGGRVAATIEALGKLQLPDSAQRVELRAVLDARADGADYLRREAGALLGARAAVAATAPDAPRLGPTAGQRLSAMVQRLRDAGFVAVEPESSLEDDAVVPAGAVFLIAAGSRDTPGFNTQAFVKAMATAIADRGGAVLVAEPSDSVWGIVASIRDDGRAVDEVSTVDQAETVPGELAVVLGLERAGPRRAGHYGVGPGAQSVLPQPTPVAG